MENVLWVHQFDPVLLWIGSLEIRYYGILFAIAMLQGGYFWCRQVMRSGRRIEEALPYVWMGIAGVIVGGRAGEILFYKPYQLLNDPLKVFTTWRGGFASHGSALGALIALWYYSRSRNMPFLEAMDRCSLSVPLTVSLVRLGNFLNSEIVGRATAVPWAIVFSKYDRMMGLPPTPRHPCQLYELGIGIAVFVMLYLIDKRLGERRPTGLMVGLFLASYFSLRFCVEFFKEVGLLSPSSPFTIGQILSIPFAVTGWVIIAKIFRTIRKAIKESKIP